MRVSIASEAAGPDRANEDFVAATTTAVVLLDGAGAPPGVDLGCHHGVAWFARTLGTTLLARIADPTGGQLSDCLREAITHTADQHVKSCDVQGPKSPGATVIAVRALDSAFEYLVLADSTLVLDRSHELEVITDPREALIGREFRAAMDATPNGTRAHEEALATYIASIAMHRNQPGGFWVAAADPTAADHAITGTVPLHQLSRVAIFSDGAARPIERFHLMDWPSALDLISRDGPAAIIRAVREAEDSDPQGVRWPRGKARDDATIALCFPAGD
jgi:hypothetical protein